MLGLTYLDARSRGIADLTGLEYATNLTTLHLNYNQISDCNAVSGLTELTYPYLAANQITNISAVSGLTKLWDLFLGSNQISDVSAVSGLTELTWLWLGNNQISDCNAVSGLTKLRRLYLYNNQISNISAISGLTKMEYLLLYDNQISDISAISGLASLKRLLLGHNQISDISALSGPTNPRELNLEFNQISDISALSDLTNLQWLWIIDNQISDIAALSSLMNLTLVNLLDNPLNTPAYCTYLPLIRDNNPGIDLRYDPNPNPLTDNCKVNILELAVFVAHWLETDCNEANNWCGWADLDYMHKVDMCDFAELARYWSASFYFEGFETGDFSKYDWQHSGDANWTVASDEAYEGDYSAKSGSISHSQQSVLEITPDIDISHISFCRKVSSENGCDHLRFYIDGQKKGQWSGDHDWEVQTYTITAGQHTLKWAYTKDGSVSTGSDCTWIDKIILD